MYGSHNTINGIAKYITERYRPKSPYHLQKLLYYCQGWSLAWTEKGLFDEDFKAISSGVMCEDFIYPKSADTYNLTENEKESINAVLRDYGNEEPYDLIEYIKNEEPWKIAIKREDKLITKESMGEFYGSL